MTFENGIKGLIIDVPDATVMTFDFNFRAGDFLSPKGKWEVAHILEHMVLGANSKYKKSREFQAVFQKNGAYNNASTGPHNLSYTVECADFEWERILKLLCLSLKSPLLSDSEFLAEMGNVREELTGDLNHNFRQVVIRTRERFGLVALNDTSRLEQMKSISIEDIRNYYKKTHTAGNLRFVIAGNVLSREKEIRKIISESLQLMPGTRFELPDENPTSFEQVYYIDKPGLENIFLFLNTFVYRKLSQQEEDALGLVDTLLTATMHSRILGEARERGLAYDISSSFNTLKSATGWWFGAELLEQNALPVIEIIHKEITRLLLGELDDSDLSAAKQYSLGRYQRSAQTVRGLSHGYASSFFFDERVEDYYAVPERIKNVSKEDVINVVRALFADNCWGMSVMGTNKDDLAKELNHAIATLWN